MLYARLRTIERERDENDKLELVEVLKLLSQNGSWCGSWCLVYSLGLRVRGYNKKDAPAALRDLGVIRV